MNEYLKFLSEEELELYNKKKSEYSSLEEETLKKARENFMSKLPKGTWLFTRHGYQTLLYDSVEAFIHEHGSSLIRPSTYRDSYFINGMVMLRNIPLVTRETAFYLKHKEQYNYYDPEPSSDSESESEEE